MIQLSRRKALLGLLGIVASPAVVKAESLMRIVRVPPLVGPVFYSRRSFRTLIDAQAIYERNVLLSVDDYAGVAFTSFRGIPIRVLSEYVNG